MKLDARIKQAAQERELLTHSMGGTADGIAGDHALPAPAFIIDAATIDSLVERLDEAVDAGLAAARP